MSIGFWQIALIAIVVILLFGRGKISDLMGDVAKGIKSFKSGLKEDDGDALEEPQQARVIEHEPPAKKPAKRAAAKRAKS